MHDGYIYTLGICGSASGSGPAPACLDLMLAAVPPVKRAAYLGEVMLSSGAVSLVDPLIEPVRADIDAAELLIIVTPLPGERLPARLTALVNAIEREPPSVARRFALLVVFADASLAGLWPLRHALEDAAIELLNEIYIPTESDPQLIADELIALARQAYGRARAMHPEALP